jgi:integrase/recombinase XerC
LIGCYTGLRFGDMRLFDAKKNIKNNRLVIYTSKTGEVVGMPLNKDLKLLFKAIDYRPLNLTNEYYNRMLKEIQGLAGIEDKLTAHISRHTFAVMCANKGISQEVTSKLLGHQSLRTTAVYYKITNERIDKELSKIFK